MAEHECSQVSAGNISTFTTNISGKLLVEFLIKSIIIIEVLLKKKDLIKYSINRITRQVMLLYPQRLFKYFQNILRHLKK